MQDEIKTPSSAKNPAVAVPNFAYEHVADIVEFLNEQSPEAAADFLAQLPLERAAEVLYQPGLEASAKLIQTLRRRHPDCHVSRSARRYVPAPQRARAREPPGTSAAREQATSLRRLLAYPPDTAGSIMTN
jgi:magnesium transporter